MPLRIAAGLWNSVNAVLHAQGAVFPGGQGGEQQAQKSTGARRTGRPD